MNKIIIGLLFFCVFLISNISQAQSDNFGRLFTTTQERQSLQELRTMEPEIKHVMQDVEAVVEENVVSDIPQIRLNGIVRRTSGKHALWLNGMYSDEDNHVTEDLHIKEIDIGNKKVSITVPDIEFDLKIGEIYDPEKGVSDMVEKTDGVDLSR